MRGLPRRWMQFKKAVEKYKEGHREGRDDGHRLVFGSFIRLKKEEIKGDREIEVGERGEIQRCVVVVG